MLRILSIRARRVYGSHTHIVYEFHALTRSTTPASLGDAFFCCCGSLDRFGVHCLFFTFVSTSLRSASVWRFFIFSVCRWQFFLLLLLLLYLLSWSRRSEKCEKEIHLVACVSNAPALMKMQPAHRKRWKKFQIFSEIENKGVKNKHANHRRMQNMLITQIVCRYFVRSQIVKCALESECHEICMKNLIKHTHRSLSFTAFICVFLWLPMTCCGWCFSFWYALFFLFLS